MNNMLTILCDTYEEYENMYNEYENMYNEYNESGDDVDDTDR